MVIGAQPDQRALVALFERHRSAHLYGLADLEEPYWSRSTWWQRDDAAVGLIGLPGVDTGVVYAISVADPAGTKELLAELAAGASLPDRFVITGPTGLVEVLAASRRPRWEAAHQKMLLVAEPSVDRPATPELRRLTLEDTRAVESLLRSDPDAGGFFHPGLIEAGLHLGYFLDGGLVSMAGVHVAGPRHEVVAIGNVVTHPDHRRYGLATLVMSGLVERLRSEFKWIGLNVAKANVGAIGLYDRLGFEWVMDYDEAEVFSD